MSYPNVRPTDKAPLLGAINPQSLAPGSASTAWIDMSAVGSILASVMAGVLGAAATLDAKVEQATSAAGAGAKDITGKAITQLTKAGADDNKQAEINVRAEDLDVNGGFTYARLTLTVGTAASLVAAQVRAFDSRYQPQADAASVDEVVG